MANEIEEKTVHGYDIEKVVIRTEINNEKGIEYNSIDIFYSDGKFEFHFYEIEL